MADCTHRDSVTDAFSGSTGCEACLAIGSRWVHLRRCTSCGHIGCCDSSPNRHATAHFRSSEHPVVQSYEPGEEWFWCYIDQAAFELPGSGPGPAHP